jgi:hypothetical protein
VRSSIVDQTDGTEDGQFEIRVNEAGALRSAIQVNSTNVVVNQDSRNIDFRVESDNLSHALFVDAGNDKIGINESSPDALLHITTNDNSTQLKLESTDGDNLVGPRMDFVRNSASPADNDILGGMRFRGENDASEELSYVEIVTNALDVTDGTEDGRIEFLTMQSGSLVSSCKMQNGATVFNESSNDIDFRVESSTQSHMLFIDAGNNRVGINQSSPSYNLDVNGDVKVSSDIYLGSQIIHDGDTNTYLEFNAGDEFQIYTAGQNRIKINGTETVFNDDSADRNFRVESDTNANAIFVDAGSNAIGFFHNNPTSAGFGSSGIIQQRVDQNGPTRFVVKNDNSGSSASSEVVMNAAGNSWVLGCGSSAKDGNDFTMALDGTAATPSVKFRLTTAGALTLGTTTQYSRTLNLERSLDVMQIRLTSTSASQESAMAFVKNGSEVGYINCTTSSTVYGTSSDARLKENVVGMTGAIDRVKQLEPKRFNFIVDADTTVDGFLAHEAQAVVPEAVSGTENGTKAIGNITDAQGNILERDITEPLAADMPEGATWTQTEIVNDYQVIDQSKIVPLLTGALKEAIAKIEDLETRLAALEAN